MGFQRLAMGFQQWAHSNRIEETRVTPLQFAGRTAGMNDHLNARLTRLRREKMATTALSGGRPKARQRGGSALARKAFRKHGENIGHLFARYGMSPSRVQKFRATARSENAVSGKVLCPGRFFAPRPGLPYALTSNSKPP